ncbi:MAG: hypothetical protein ACREIQ_12365 [Nitrospiria bacterium]
MKHIFYVVYILFYTGAVFVAGMFVGQMLERVWAARERAAQSSLDRSSEVPVQSQSSIPIGEHNVVVSGKR